MVKKAIKITILVIIAAAFCLTTGCRQDLLGIFGSNDLDERLKDRDNFVFLESRDWTSIPLGDTYSFVVIADTHLEDGKDFRLGEMAKVIADYNEKPENENTKIKFAVILGDITQHCLKEDIDLFIKIADSFGVPCYPVIGNHDFYFGRWHIWRDNIGSTSYRIDSDSTTLFMLDSANSFFGKDQLDWLERELETAKGRVFVFTHSPLFVKGPVDMQQITNTKERARIVSILRNKCDIMFMGHLHKEIRNTVGNVQYIAVEDFINSKTYGIVTVTPGKKVSAYEPLKLNK